jgi:NAD+ kinase
MRIARVGIVHASGSEAISAKASELSAMLRQAGFEVFMAGDGPLRGVDLLVSIGGDGAVLHAFRLACELGTPILGVNMGYLGYLTQVDAADLASAVDALASGNYEIERRAAVGVAMIGEDGSRTGLPPALNEVVIQRAMPGQAVKIATTIDDEPLASYSCDGLIIASPTGSTAYNLSVRGPIVDPRLEVMVITPISAHTFFDRSIVVGDTDVVELMVEGTREAVLVVDGREEARLAPGARIRCTLDRKRAAFVHLPSQRSFYYVLKEKFELNRRT